MACLDTSFLVDLIREQTRKKLGPATRKLVQLDERNHSLTTTLLSVGELYAGAGAAQNQAREIAKVEGILSLLEILPFETSTARIFGLLAAELKGKGAQIGVVDTLISAVVLENDEVLITRNIRHFSRVERLRVESY